MNILDFSFFMSRSISWRSPFLISPLARHSTVFIRGCIHPSVCPLVCLSVRPSVHFSIGPFVCPSVRPFVRPSVRLSVHLSHIFFCRPEKDKDEQKSVQWWRGGQKLDKSRLILCMQTCLLVCSLVGRSICRSIYLIIWGFFFQPKMRSNELEQSWSNTVVRQAEIRKLQTHFVYSISLFYVKQGRIHDVISRMLPALKQPFCTDLAWFHAFGMDGLTNQPTDQQTDGVTIESRAYE